jgi:DNA-binding NtrC family response regulator
VAVIDDDRLVLDATAGLLRTWGCDVISGPTAEGAMAGHSAGPDLVISDYHLEGGRTGLDEIVTLRARYGHGLPAIVITGDVTLAVRESVEARGLPLLYKPLSPMTLRATATRVLADRNQLAPT